MKKWLKYTLYSIVWCAIAAYIIYASVAVRAQRKAQVVDRVAIEIVDSSATANLVTRPMVERWIAQSKIRTVGQAIDSVSLSQIESYILANGFVDEVKCYTTHSGVLRIKLSQLRPSLRIMLDSYNCYVTSEGYVFGRPPLSSRYSSVVTGDYNPLFRAGYTGYIEDIYKSDCEEIAAEIHRIEVKNIYPLYAERVKLREALREVNSRYINRRFGQSRKEFDEEVIELKERNRNDRAKFTRAIYEVNQKIESERSKQKVYDAKQKKLDKKYQDFINLITFVDVVENDKFWSSEIVQIVASESTNGDLRLELIPRSGDHTIIFGRLTDIETKLSNAKTFYKRVLASQGWQEFKSINVEYKNQIVCK